MCFVSFIFRFLAFVINIDVHDAFVIQTVNIAIFGYSVLANPQSTYPRLKISEWFAEEKQNKIKFIVILEIAVFWSLVGQRELLQVVQNKNIYEFVEEIKKTLDYCQQHSDLIQTAFQALYLHRFELILYNSILRSLVTISSLSELVCVALMASFGWPIGNAKNIAAL